MAGPPGGNREEGPPREDEGAPLADEQILALRRQLVGAVRRCCPAWLSDQAEDIVQTALVRLLEVHRRGGGADGFNPFYIRRAAYSATVDEMRRYFRRQDVSRRDEFEVDSVPSTDGQPDQVSRALAIDRGVRDCLARMARPRRLVVTCRLQGYSVPETAALFGWTTKKTEHLLRRGLGDLRACMRSKGIEP